MAFSTSHLIVYLVVVQAVVCSFDPCVNYTTDNDPTRSINYMYSGPLSSDFGLASDWYRFTSPAGGDMPTEPVSTPRCNAIIPIYLTGGIPSVADGIQTVRACAAYLQYPCVRDYDIPIKNCGDFRVYYLTRTSQGFDRYCAGTEVPCADGLFSPTGYTPFCSDIEVDLNLPSDPTISVRTEYNPVVGLPGFCSPSYIFECGTDHQDTSVFYDVQWLVDGTVIQENVTEYAIAHADMPSTLSSEILEEHGYQLGINLTCRVAARLSNEIASVTGSPRETDFFIGVVVDDSSQFISITEGGPPAYYNARFTIPFRCFGIFCTDEEQEANCQVEIDIVNPNHDDDTCTADADVLVELDRNQDGCTTTASTTGFSLKVHANPDHVYNPQRQIVLQLQTRPNDQYPLWSDYQLPRAHVIINDTERQALTGHECRVYNDPHFKSFDGTRFEVQLTGAFIMYKHKTLPILLEAYFVDRGHYTHQCGGAVRSGSQVFVFDACRQNQPLYISGYQCNEGLRNMQVKRINPKRFEITLPTGTKISLGDYWMTVDPSLFDFDQTEGLCGNFNDNPADSDDRVIRGTNQVDVRVNRAFNVFSNSWRVSDEESLYYGAVRDTVDFNDIVFCTCSGDDTDPGASCSAAPNVGTCLAGTHDEASGDRHRCTLSRRRKRRNVEGSDTEEQQREFFPFDIDFVAEPVGWVNPWTLETATEYCENYFASLEALAACNQVPGTDRYASVEDCISDIEITGSPDHSQIHVDAFAHTCVEEATRWHFESEAVEDLPVQPAVVEQILQQMCQSDCSGHGTCQDGACVCEAGYTETDCSIEINHIPQLFDLPSNGICARNVRPCEMTFVNGDQFIEDSVHCRLQLKDMNQMPISEEITLEGEYVNLQTMICPIDVEDLGVDIADIDGPYYVDISVSNNGRDFSEIKQLIVYSALCWQCSQEEGCQNLENRCVSGDVCYNDGETIPDRPCQYCDGDSGSWLIQDAQCYIDSECYNHNAQNPFDENEICNTGVDQTSWSPVNIDECETANCGNGECEDGPNFYTCRCFTGWSGQHCEVDIDECEAVSCGNGDCVDGNNTYACICDAGWTGAACNVPITITIPEDNDCPQPYTGPSCTDLLRYDCENTNPCKPGSLIYYPHVQRSKYIQCSWDMCHTMPCEGDLEWDQRILSCNWPSAIA